VSGTVRKNIFLVVKEALQNIVKHSKATEVHITLLIEPKEISLYIQDNGIGIDFENLRPSSNGLTNMRKRMQNAKIDFSIENSNGGTLLSLIKKTS
jgi:signal transduction histidine kinase